MFSLPQFQRYFPHSHQAELQPCGSLTPAEHFPVPKSPACEGRVRIILNMKLLEAKNWPSMVPLLGKGSERRVRGVMTMFTFILSPVTGRQHTSQFGCKFNSSGCALSAFNPCVSELAQRNHLTLDHPRKVGSTNSGLSI